MGRGTRREEEELKQHKCGEEQWGTTGTALLNFSSYSEGGLFRIEFRTLPAFFYYYYYYYEIREYAKA